MVPATTGADLDGVAAAVAAFGPELAHLGLGLHRASTWRKAGSEYVTNNPERRLVTYRTLDGRGLRAVDGNTQQFGLSIADICSGQFSGAVAEQHLPSGEAVVHAAREFAGATRYLWLQKGHGGEGYRQKAGVWTALREGPRRTSFGPPDFALMSESHFQISQSRRHPSAGNLNSRPTLVRVGDVPMQLPPVSYPHGGDIGSDQVQFGPDLDDTGIGRLIGSAGPMEGRRVLVLGCGAGASAITLARKGARVIAVEASTARLTQARAAAEMAEVKIEFHHSDLADLAFLRGDSIELVVAVYSLAGVQDLGRVFRQLHRIMKPEAALVLSLPHPFSMMLEADEDDLSSPYLTRSSWADQVIPWRAGGDEGVTHVHQISDLFTTLIRSNFRVDALVEPPAEEGRRSIHWSPLAEWLPSTIIVRARKQGT